MRCPQCNTKLDLISGSCPNCGYLLTGDETGELVFLSEMDRDLKRLDEARKELRNGIERMSARMRSHVQSVQERLLADKCSVAEDATAKQETPVTATPERNPVVSAAEGGRTTETPPPLPKETAKEPVMEVARKPEEVTLMNSKGRDGGSRKPEDSSADSFEIRLGQKWLLVIGIVTMILGVGYFLKYSFDQGWIGPAGRVAMAYAWGAALMGGGEYFRRRLSERFGYSLSAAGAATLYFGTFAAHHIYGLFPMALSYVLMAAVTLGLCVLSVRFSAFWLAVMGMLGGFGTPFMLGMGEGQWFVLGYTAVLNLGFLFISYRRRWQSLEAIGLAFTYALFGWWLFLHMPVPFGAYPRELTLVPALGFTAFFAVLYHTVPFATAYLGEDRKRGSVRVPLMVLINTSLSLLVCLPIFARNSIDMAWMGLPFMLHAAALASMGAYLKLRLPEEQGALAALFTGAGLLAAIAVPVTLTGYWLTIGWVLLTLVLQQAGYRLGRRELAGGAYILLLIAAGRFVFHDYSDIFRLNLNNMTFRLGYASHMLTRWVATTGVLVPVFTAAFAASRRREQSLLTFDGRDHVALYGLFGVILFISANVENIAFFAEYLRAARFASISVLWTVFSVGLMLIGFRKSSTVLRRVSLALFTLTLVKVFFVDMAHVGTPWRILSFIVLGTVLMATSYLYYRFRDRIIEAIGESGEKTVQNNF